MPFETLKVPFADALTRMDALANEFKSTGKHPFLIGNDEDLESLRNLMSPPLDGGAEILSQSESLDVSEWLKAQKYKPAKTLAKSGVEQQAGFVTLIDLLSGEPKPEITIGLIAVEQPHHIFAKLGWGGWNECPPPEVHVAFHKWWGERFGAVPVALSGDVVECFVQRPPTERDVVLALAGEQYAYCPDVVDQGQETVGRLAASLVGAKVWYFWWD